MVFERDDDFCEKFQARGKKLVDTKFAYVAREGLFKHQHDVFFIGRDIDSHQDAQFTLRRDHFAKECIDNLLLMLPVQCVEHWLWLLKYRQGNPKSTKNVSFHMHPNKKAKLEVYGQEDPPNEISNPIVDDLSKQFDITWLESRSESFRHFHKQVLAFLAAYSSVESELLGE
ncbi:hypothetical protein [Spirosoma montaniterrae]|uniref:Uncharacterized protein n=1 Tax=Spirosoma montaniterrae TaxID=1178516 RepID=A0A1P9X2E3_9BACT|nr:hypothetical protein [Spirosoma montaniterrae]AQG81791.1 hypothetical protein AWR27_22285 [Spirosoma montaniterrae]